MWKAYLSHPQSTVSSENSNIGKTSHPQDKRTTIFQYYIDNKPLNGKARCENLGEY
jgi:hypothetical protein